MSISDHPDEPSSWAWQKHARARQHSVDLADLVRAWQVDLEMVAEMNPDGAPRPGVLDDEDAWSPPLAAWGLIFSDAVNELRTCLDAIVWSHADDSVLSVRQRRALGFPIVADADRWAAEGERTLRVVPPAVVDRIRSVQPFTRPEHERHRDLLLILDEWANRCRVRQPLSAELVGLDRPAQGDLELRLTAPTLSGPEPALETLEALLTHVAMILTFVGAERWGVIAAPEGAARAG